jgi:hypothetical protein
MATRGQAPHADITTTRLAELDERASQLEQRMAELRDELVAVQCGSVPTAQIQRAVALFDPVWDMLLVSERFRILHLLIESVGYDGSTGYAPRSASTWSTITRSGTIKAWAASSSCRPPISTGPDRSYAGNACAGSCASTIARRPETPRSSFRTLREAAL